MRRLLAVGRKEFLQILRDPLSLIMLLGLPAFMLVVFGYAVSFDVEDLAMGIDDRSRSAASRDLVAAFTESRHFDVRAELDGGSIEGALEEGAVRLVLVIPEDFGERIAAGEGAPVQILVDGTDSNTAATALGYASGTVSAWGGELFTASLEGAGLEAALDAAIRFEPRIWYNPELESSHFLVPGLIGFILMLTAVLSTSLSLVREVERGTLEQLRVAPLGTAELLLGKILPYLVISLLAMALILAAARRLFGVVVQGSYVDLFLVTVLFLVAGFAWGLLISTIADSQAIAFQIGMMTALLPTLILSGFIFPIHNMPTVLQWISHIVPARYYLIVLRGIVLKGAGLAPYWDQLLSLTVFTVVILALATFRFARQGGR